MDKKLKPLEPKLLSRLEKLGAGWADEPQAEIMEIPDHGSLPLWVLPEGAVPFNSDLGFYVFFKAFTGVLVAQVFYFDLKDGAGDWAIPMKYTPRDEAEAMRKDLGFDEGWENGAPGPTFLIKVTEKWKQLFKLALTQERLGITIKGGESIYPSNLSPYAVDSLKAVLEIT